MMTCSLCGAVTLYLAKHDMDGGEVEVEHPTQPECGIVAGLLLINVMPSAEVVCNVEQVAVICRGKQRLYFGA